MQRKEELTQKEKDAIRNGIYIVSGITIAALATTLAITKGNFNNYKTNTTNEIKTVRENEQKIVNDYNGLAINHNKELETSKLKDATINALEQDKTALNRNLYNVRLQLNEKNGAYEKAIHTLDSISNVLAHEKTTHKSELEKLLAETNQTKEGLQNEINLLKNDLTEYRSLTLGQADTLNLLQRHLNGYIMNRRPLKEKNFENVFLPNELRFMPTGRPEVREVRTLNKEYK